MSICAHRQAEHGTSADDFSIVFFGRRCPFTAIPLQRLAAGGMPIRAIFLSSSAPGGPPVRLRATRSTIPLFSTSNDHSSVTVERIAREHAISLYDLQRPLAGELEQELARLAPALLIASCFPWRVPARIVAQAALGAINLHPSLLPRRRGPDPLFWAYQRGDTSTGVTVHRIIDTLDAGAILGQRTVSIPDDLPGDQLETEAAGIGADLLVETIDRLRRGCVVSRAQDEASASYDAWPSNDDLLVRPDWSVQHALNFITGVGPLGYEPLIETTKGTFDIQRARRVLDPQTTSAAESWISEKALLVRFEDGTVEVSLGSRVVEE